MGIVYWFLITLNVFGRFNVLDLIFSDSFLGVFRDGEVGAS
jgi:hypothetical protein